MSRAYIPTPPHSLYVSALKMKVKSYLKKTLFK